MNFRRRIFGSQRNENSPNRFLFRAAAWSRDTSRGQRKSRVRFFARAFRHRTRDLLAHRPVFHDEARIDLQHSRLRFVGISDEAHEENDGSAGHVRDPVRERTTRARFGDRQRLLSLRQKSYHDFFETCAVARENGRTERCRNNRIGPVERRTVSDDSQVHFPGPGAITKLQARNLQQPFADRLLDERFAHARDAICPAIHRRFAWNDRAENGQDETFEHRVQLAGRAREKKQMRRGARAG